MESSVGGKWNGVGGWPLSLIITLVFAMCPDTVLSPLHKFLFNPHKIPMAYLSPHFSR